MRAATLRHLFAAQSEKDRAILNNIKQAAEFLWQRKFDGQAIVKESRRPRIFLQNGYFFEHEDRFRPLFDPPGLEQTKFDQVYEWAVDQAGQQ